MAQRRSVEDRATQTSVVRVGEAAPAFLQEYVDQDESTNSMGEYRVLSRCKVVQSLTATEVKEKFGEGSAVMWPTGVLVAESRTPFKFVPLFFFTEFAKWRDRRDKATPTIVERSFDKGGELARRSRDAARRFEQYDGGPSDKPWQYRYVEHLNFVGLIYGDHPAAGSPFVVSFSRGEFFVGMNFCSAIMMRKVGDAPAPLWSQVWQLQTAYRQRGDNKWWGLDFEVPEDGSWIQQEEAAAFRALHEEMRELHKKEKIVVDHTDSEDETVTPDPEMS